MTPKLSTRSRIGKMLVASAVVVPALSVAAMIFASHLFMVHYSRHDLIVWIVVDAVALVLGLILTGEEGL